MLVSVQPGCCHLWVGLVVPATRPRADLWRRRSRLDWAMDSDHLRITVAHRSDCFSLSMRSSCGSGEGLGDFSATVGSLGLVEGLVDFAGSPEVMKKHGQLTCDCDDGSLLGILAAAGRNLGAEAAQVRVRSKGAQDVVSSVDQQSPHTPVPMLGNTSFGIRVSRLLAPRDQPEEGSDRATLWESLRGFQGQNKCQRRDRSNSRHLAKKLRLWVTLLSEPLNLSIQSLDPIIQRSDLF